MSSVDMCEHGWPGTGCQECKSEALERRACKVDRFWSEEARNIRCVREADYDALLAERDRLREERDSQQRVCIAEMGKANQLRARIAKFEQFVEWVEQAPVSSGVCCCGDYMGNHSSPLTCGHEPVDGWHHALHGWLKELGLSK